MTSKPIKKENAKTRYDAKKPTVSFRVSKEEYERLDALRKDRFISFRDLVLAGAGIIGKDRAGEKKRLEEAVKAARIDALRHVQIGTCPICHQPMYWNLNRSSDIKLLTEAVYVKNYCHSECSGRS